MNQCDLMNIYRMIYLPTAEYTFFSRGRGVREDWRLTGGSGGTELHFQGAASFSPLAEVGSPAGRPGDFPMKTKRCCATPVLGTGPRLGLTRTV